MPSAARILAISVIVLAAVAGTGAGQAQVYSGPVRVIDGDTLEMTGMRLRLFGIDAVELHQTCDRGGETWTCGLDAANTLRRLLEQKEAACTQKSIDPYGRTVAVCRVEGRDLGEIMVASGLAVALPDFSEDYVASERSARVKGIGIWATRFVMPAEYRKADPKIAAQDRAALVAERRRQTTQPAPGSASRPGVYYRSCYEARAAGAAPIRRGEPGYRPEMDGDHDGIACEPLRGAR